MINTTCQCGGVSLAITEKPSFINLCDCSLCRTAGAAWGYFTSEDVQIEGQTQAYRRRDYETPAIELRFCGTCGASTHWLLTEQMEEARIGVNMRLFSPGDTHGIEARTLDGHHWTGDGPAEHRRAPGILGKDVLL